MNETKNDSKKPFDKKKIFIIAGILVVILIIILAASRNSKKAEEPSNVKPENVKTETTKTNQEPAVTAETETKAIQASMEGSRVEAPGASIITKDNKVVDQTGVELKSDAPVQSPEAPKQTQPVDIKALSARAIKIEATANGFVPAEFKVKKGEPITMSLTGGTTASHVLIFKDSSLGAVMIAVRPGETRAITFKGPEKAGEYQYVCDFPGHSNETGKMIVE